MGKRGSGKSLTLGCGLAQIAALKRHRRFIHYRAQFDSPPHDIIVQTKAPRGAMLLFVVEVGRVELPSEDMMTQLSTSVAVVQVFPLRRSQRRDRRSGSFIKSGPGQSLPGFVPYPK